MMVESSTKLPRPQPLSMIFENIPTELKCRKRWVIWRYIWKERHQKWDKPPLQVDGAPASSINPRTWTTFEMVREAYEHGLTLPVDHPMHFDGVGFVPARPFVFGDLDHCVDDGKISAEAKENLDLADTYAELSPSGTGVRFIAKGKLPLPDKQGGRKKDNAEIYAFKHYLTLTGHRLPEYPATINERESQMGQFYERNFEAQEKKPTNSRKPLKDFEVVDLMFNSAKGHDIKMLMDGCTSDYKSQSEADLALCNHLAFWTAKDRAQMDRIFRQSGLMRPKWDEKHGRGTYGEMTIAKAIADTKDVYDAAQTEMDQIEEGELDKILVPANPMLNINLEEDNFVKVYMNYGESVSDSYIDYWFAGALVCLSVVANRNVVIRLKQGDVHPNIWANMLGLSSVSRKSTSVDKTEALIDSVSPDYRAKMPDEFSSEAMIEHLDGCSRAFMIKDEAAGFMAVMQKEYMRGTKDSLMKLYDCKSIHRELRTSRRKADKTEFHVNDPYLTMLLATTPNAFASNTTLLDITSGWLPRFLHFFPNAAKTRWMPLEEGAKTVGRLDSKSHERLEHIKTQLYDLTEPREMHLSKRAAEYYTEWQRLREREIVKSRDDRKAQFYSRLAVYVLKMAMLFTIGRADYQEGMEISAEHVAEATRLVDEYFMPMAIAVCDMVGKQADKNLQDKILAILGSRGGKITKRELMRAIHVKKKDLDDSLVALFESGEIKQVSVKNPQGKNVVYVILAQHDYMDSVPTVPTVNTSLLSHTKESNTDRRGEKFACDTATVVTDETNGTIEPSFPSTVVEGSTGHPLAPDDSELLERIYDRLKRENSPVTPFALADKARSAGRPISIDACRAWLSEGDGSYQVGNVDGSTLVQAAADLMEHDTENYEKIRAYCINCVDYVDLDELVQKTDIPREFARNWLEENCTFRTEGLYEIEKPYLWQVKLTQNQESDNDFSSGKDFEPVTSSVITHNGPAIEKNTTITDCDFTRDESEKILNVIAQSMRDQYLCREKDDRVGLYMPPLLSELPDISQDRLTKYLLENGWIRASDELSEIWWAPDDIVDAYHRPAWLADEKKIVWNRDPLQYSYLREVVSLTTHPRKKITGKGKNCAFVVGYTINRNGAGSCYRRYWYLTTWDHDLDSRSVYDGSTFPCEAVDPRSIRVGKESKRSTFSGGSTDSTADQAACT